MGRALPRTVLSNPRARIGAAEVHLLALHVAGLVNGVADHGDIIGRKDNVDLVEIKAFQSPVACAGHFAILLRINPHRPRRAGDQAFLGNHGHRSVRILVDHRLPETGLKHLDSMGFGGHGSSPAICP